MIPSWLAPLLTAVGFLEEHKEWIELGVTAIEKGLTRDQLSSAIQKALIEASDAEMNREFPNG